MTREKLKALLEEYGRVAIWTYLVIWLSVLAAFGLAIATGLRASGGATGLAVIGAAWVATKLTQPLRIAATLALTPVVAAMLKRRRGAATRDASSDPLGERRPPQ
jgi:hypothetical protein